jgi:hypothetical protein
MKRTRSSPVAIMACFLAAGLILGGCPSHGKKTATTPSKNVCPEFRHIKCLAAMACQIDEERGCEVCICTNAMKNRPPDEAADSAASAGDKGGHERIDFPH